MPEPILKVDNVHTYYGPLHVLKGVNYDLYEGEIVCLLGGNASGKSTTMKTVLGLVKPIRRSLGSFRPIGYPAVRRGTGAAVIACVALVASCALAGLAGILGAQAKVGLPNDGFALTGLALLGVARPAIPALNSLDDIRRMFAASDDSRNGDTGMSNDSQAGRILAAGVISILLLGLCP